MRWEPSTGSLLYPISGTMDKHSHLPLQIFIRKVFVKFGGVCGTLFRTGRKSCRKCQVIVETFCHICFITELQETARQSRLSIWLWGRCSCWGSLNRSCSCYISIKTSFTTPPSGLALTIFFSVLCKTSKPGVSLSLESKHANVNRSSTRQFTVQR